MSDALRLFKITRGHPGGYDTFDSAVVAAVDAEEARKINPNGWEFYDTKQDAWVRWSTMIRDDFSSGWDWTHINDVTAVEVGVASEGVKKGVVVASFNAG